MNTRLTPEDFDLPPESEEEVYASLLRALQRNQGFGLFFVQCTKGQGSKQVLNLRQDLSGKYLETLRIEPNATTLYDKIEALWQKHPFDTLVIDGLEDALSVYENKAEYIDQWASKELYFYSWSGVPPILSHLNQLRDKLRNHFPANFVFLVSKYGIDYILQRSADFFDWRSGLFIFPSTLDDQDQGGNYFQSDAQNQDKRNQGGSRSFTKKSIEEYQSMSLAEWQKEKAHLEVLYNEVQLDSEKVEIDYELGLAYYAKQSYENALIRWDQAVKLSPGHVNGWYSRGLALRKLDRLPAAIESYNRAIELQPIYAKVYNNRGLAYYGLGDVERAIADYTQALEQDPNYAIAYNNRGIAHGEMGRLDDAIADYTQATRRQPDYAVAYYNRGNAYKDQDKNLSANADYTKAIQLKSNDASFYNNRGIVRYRLKEYEAAIADYNEALRLRPVFNSAYMGRKDAFSSLEDFSSAIADYDQALKLKLDDPNIYYCRGIAYKNLGNSARAIADFNKAISLYPDDNPWRKTAIDHARDLQAMI